jgi:hypothetical protein
MIADDADAGRQPLGFCSCFDGACVWRRERGQIGKLYRRKIQRAEQQKNPAAEVRDVLAPWEQEPTTVTVTS